MIEGLKLCMTSDELKRTLAGRIEYHSKKADWFEKKATELAPELEQFAEDAEVLGKYSNANRNPTQELQRQHRHHADRVTVFKFMMEHIIPSETYVLEENDLRRLEVLASW